MLVGMMADATSAADEDHADIGDADHGHKADARSIPPDAQLACIQSKNAVEISITDKSARNRTRKAVNPLNLP